MLALLLLAAQPEAVVARDIHADPASISDATRGLVHAAAPRLGYDLAAVAAWRDEAEPRFRLAYAAEDLRRATEARDLLIAHGLAADIIRDEEAGAEAARIASR